jgi:Ala-tRNA(Pro) deacylase
MAKIPSKVTKFLEKSGLKYEEVSHKTVFTAYDKAATLRVKPNIIGKTLVLKTDPPASAMPKALRAGSEMAMVLIPGNKNLDKVKFQKVLNVWRKKQGIKLVKKIDFISEAVMKNKFKGIKLGAVPPFGKLFGIPTFIDKGLAKEKAILISTGIYEKSFKVSPKIFEKLEIVSGAFSKAKK